MNDIGEFHWNMRGIHVYRWDSCGRPTGQPDRSKYLLVHKVFIQRPENDVIDRRVVHTMCMYSYLLSITSILDKELMLYVRTSVSTHEAIWPYSDVHVSLQT